MNFKKWKGIYE